MESGTQWTRILLHFVVVARLQRSLFAMALIRKSISSLKKLRLTLI